MQIGTFQNEMKMQMKMSDKALEWGSLDGNLDFNIYGWHKSKVP